MFNQCTNNNKQLQVIDHYIWHQIPINSHCTILTATTPVQKAIASGRVYSITLGGIRICSDAS